jgi:hypothetical protein
MFNRITLLIILYLNILPTAYARSVTKEDLGYEYLEKNDKIYVNKDGSHIIETYAKVKIINENGRDLVAGFFLDYNSGIEKLELITAKTINDKHSYPVQASNIEDKPIASNTLGFDKINRLRVAFSQLKVGSIVEFSYKNTVSASLAKHFSKTLVFGQNTYENKYTCSIVSELKLNLEKNRLNKNISVKEQYINGLHKIEIKSLRPQCYGNINEQGLTLALSDFPWLKLASTDNWSEFGQPLAQNYARVLKQELPPLYRKIHQSAMQQNTVDAKINAVSSALNENIKYLGDWRTNEGKFFPRNLQLVNDTEFADCKDYSTAMVAILRAMGIKADVALVMRGQILEEPSPKLPSLDNFNHAIVKVIDGERVLWVDPTNPNSLVGINREDISYRHTLVLNEQHPKLEFIPASTPEQDQIFKIIDITLNQDNTVDLNAKVQLNGLAATPFTGALLSVTKENIEHAILTNIATIPEDVLAYSIQLPDLNSRIVKNINFEAKIREKLTTIKTTSGKAYRVQSSSGEIYAIALDAVGNLSLGAPSQIKSSYIIHGFKQQLNKNLDLEIDTQWFNYKRTATLENDDLRIDFTYVNKVYTIYNEEFKSQEYLDALNRLQRDYMGGFAIILDS